MMLFKDVFVYSTTTLDVRSCFKDVASIAICRNANAHENLECRETLVPLFTWRFVSIYSLNPKKMFSSSCTEMNGYRHSFMALSMRNGFHTLRSRLVAAVTFHGTNGILFVASQYIARVPFRVGRLGGERKREKERKRVRERERERKERGKGDRSERERDSHSRRQSRARELVLSRIKSNLYDYMHGAFNAP